MPAAVVKKFAHDKGMSIEEAETKWQHAKEAADKSDIKKGSISYWQYTTSVFKKMMGIND